MKHIIKLASIYLLFFLPFSSCVKKNKTDLSNHIQTKKTSQHVRVKGTKVYGIIPSEYQHIKEFSRYQKNENQYIQIMESNNSNFNQAKTNFTKEAIEAKGITIDVFNNIKFNEYDAIYGEGPSKKPNETKIMLIFGNDSFYVLIAGVCKTADQKGKNELRNIIKSIYYDTSFKLDPLELANFQFDHTITNFKYSMTMSNIFLYSENGKNDPNYNTANAFQIAVLPKMDDENAVDFSKKMLFEYQRKGIKFDNKAIKKSKINNQTAYILESNINYQYEDGILYQAIIVFDNTTIMFGATAFIDLENYILKYKMTAESISIK